MIHSPRQRRFTALSASPDPQIRAVRTPKPHQRGLTFKIMMALFAVMAVLVGTAATAFANAANPLPDASGTANVLNGNVTQNANGSWHVNSGTVDVQVGGTWNWGALSGSSPQASCTSRYGVGWAVDWAGLSSSASAPGALGALQINKKVGGGGFFHIFDTDMVASGNVYKFTGPCTPAELALEPGHPSGPWSATHTYNAGDTIPQNLCVNMYDMHGSPGNLNNGDEDPLGNNDNSIRTNSFDPGAHKGSCFAPIFINTQHLIVHIFDCSTGTATTTEVPGGKVSAAGPSTLSNKSNPVDDPTVKSGDYDVTASAPAGTHFVDCGKGTNDTDGTATHTGVNVPVNGTGTTIFYVAQNTQHLQGHIYDCSTGTQTTTEIPGGTIGATGPTTVPTQANPLDFLTVATGDFTVNAGAPAKYHFVQCTGAAPAGGVVINSPTSATQVVNVPVNGVGTAIFYAAPDKPGLSITKAASAGTVTAGDAFDYTLTASNAGPGTATNAHVTDSIPAGLTIDKVTTSVGTCNTTGQNIDCALGDLAAGASATIKVHVVTSTAVCGKVTNTGSVAADNNAKVDSNPVDVIIVCPNPALDITKSASATTVNVGDSFDYTLVVTSVGGATSTDVHMTDDIPTGLDIVGTPTSTSGTCTTSGQHVDCALGDLAAANAAGGTKSATITVHVTATPAACGKTTNTGHAAASNVTTVDSNPVDVVVNCPPGGNLDKTNDADGDGNYHKSETAPLPGIDVPFRVVLTNTGPISVVIDDITDVFGSHSINPTCAAAFVGQTVAPGASITCDFVVTNYSPAAGSSLDNEITVNVHDAGNPGNKKTLKSTSTVKTAATPPLSLDVVKTNDGNGDGVFTKDETGVENANVNFRVSITNNSAVPVVIDSVTDVWPGATEFAPACAATIVGTTLPPGGSISCDFTVANYVPTSTAGAKTNTVTVKAHDSSDPGNTTTQKDTSTVRGEAPSVLPSTVVRALPRTGSDSFALAGVGIFLLALGVGLMMLSSGRIPQAAMALRSSVLTAPVMYSRSVLVERTLGAENRRKLKGR